MSAPDRPADAGECAIKNRRAAARRAAPAPARRGRDLLGELIGEGREPLQLLSIIHMCQTLAVSRAASYRWKTAGAALRWPRECVSLAVLLDAHSRRGLGWALDRSLAAELALAALPMALATRQGQPGLVHHSDRGGQYAAQMSTNVLKAHGIRMRMSRTGKPYDHAQAERFLTTLTWEAGYLFDYANLAEARARKRHTTPLRLGLPTAG